MKDLAGYRQQDAHEYYQFLVNNLHSSTEGRNEAFGEPCNCFIHRAFFGQLQSSIACNDCGNTSRTEEPMMDLALAFQVQRKSKAVPTFNSGDYGQGDGADATPTLEGCLESYTAEEQLSPSDYTCGQCSAKGATKQLKMKKLPVILCMQLKVSFFVFLRLLPL